MGSSGADGAKPASTQAAEPPTVGAPMPDNSSQRTQKAQEPSPKKAEATDDVVAAAADTDPFFVVRIGRSLYGMPVYCVRAVEAQQKPMRVPTAPQHLLGIVNVRSRLVTVLDIRVLLGVVASPEATGEALPRLIIIRAAGSPFAFIADEVLGLLDVPRTNLRQFDSQGAGSGGNSAVLGRHDGSMGAVTLLSPEALIAPLLDRSAS